MSRFFYSLVYGVLFAVYVTKSVETASDKFVKLVNSEDFFNQHARYKSGNNYQATHKNFRPGATVIIYVKSPQINIWLEGDATNTTVIVTDVNNMECLAEHTKVENSTLECEEVNFHKEHVYMNTTCTPDICEPEIPGPPNKITTKNTIKREVTTAKPTKPRPPVRPVPPIYYQILFIFKLMCQNLNNYLKLLYQFIHLYQPQQQFQQLLYKPYQLWSLMKLYFYRLPHKLAIFNPSYLGFGKYPSNRFYYQHMLWQIMNRYKTQYQQIHRYPLPNYLSFRLWSWYYLQNLNRIKLIQRLPVGMVKWYLNSPKYVSPLFKLLYNRYNLFNRFNGKISYCLFSNYQPLRWNVLNIFQPYYIQNRKRYYSHVYNNYLRNYLGKNARYQTYLKRWIKKYPQYYKPLQNILSQQYYLPGSYTSFGYPKYNFNSTMYRPARFVQKYPTGKYFVPRFPGIQNNRIKNGKQYYTYGKNKLWYLGHNSKHFDRYRPTGSKFGRYINYNRRPSRIYFEGSPEIKVDKQFLKHPKYPVKNKYSQTVSYTVFTNNSDFGKYGNRMTIPKYFQPRNGGDVTQPDSDEIETRDSWYVEYSGDYRPLTNLLYRMYQSYFMVYRKIYKYAIKFDKYYIDLLIKTYQQKRKNVKYPRSHDDLLNLIYAGTGSYNMYLVLFNTYFYIHSSLNSNLYKPLINP